MNITGLRQRRSAVGQNLKADDSLAAMQAIPRRPVVQSLVETDGRATKTDDAAGRNAPSLRQQMPVGPSVH